MHSWAPHRGTAFSAIFLGYHGGTGTHMTEHAQRKQKSNRKSKDLTFFLVNFTYDLEFMMATNIRIYIFDSGLIFYPTYVLCMFTRCVSTNLSYTFYDIHDVPLAEDVLRMSATRIIGIVQPWKGLTNRKFSYPVRYGLYKSTTMYNWVSMVQREI